MVRTQALKQVDSILSQALKLIPRPDFALLYVFAAVSTYGQNINALASDAAYQRAFEAVKQNEPKCWVSRNEFAKLPPRLFKKQSVRRSSSGFSLQLGLANVRLDKAGNVIGVRPGAMRSRIWCLAAHLDTVFPPETDVKVRATAR